MDEVLAWHIYPFPDGTNYGRKELLNPDIVIEVFDYAQILEAAISKVGWAFLLQYYGYAGLYSLDKESDWFGCHSLEEFQESVDSMIECSPDAFSAKKINSDTLKKSAIRRWFDSFFNKIVTF